MRERSPAEQAAFDELRAAFDSGDERAEERAWHRLVVASGRPVQRFRFVVGPGPLNGRKPYRRERDE